MHDGEGAEGGGLEDASHKEAAGARRQICDISDPVYASSTP
jgi:hypothetical protein